MGCLAEESAQQGAKAQEQQAELDRERKEVEALQAERLKQVEIGTLNVEDLKLVQGIGNLQKQMKVVVGSREKENRATQEVPQRARQAAADSAMPGPGAPQAMAGGAMPAPEAS